jgi:hypothetical protein
MVRMVGSGGARRCSKDEDENQDGWGQSGWEVGGFQ